MRIISGTLGGRQFDSPGHRTHPMSDKVRGALFNILGDIGELTVLDAFSGSGALSFEAISRGAARALALDSDKHAQKVIASNIDALGLAPQIKLIKASASAWLETQPDQTFDIVLCDPPYHDVQQKLIERLAARVRPGGILVLSWPAKVPLPELPGLERATARNYGDAQLGFYRRD